MHELIQEITKEFDDTQRYAGVMLMGSGARGELRPYSDIDLLFVTFDEIENEHDRYALVYRSGRLVSVSRKSLLACHSAFGNPSQAIYTVQGLRDCKLIRDSENSDLARLKQAAENFDWTPALRTAAHQEASYILMGNAEEVHKILNGLAEADNMSLVNGAWGLALAMPMVMALAKGVLSSGDSLFRAQICEVMGIDSMWSHYHGIAIGSHSAQFAQVDSTAIHSSLASQAIGAYLLYEETAGVISDMLTLKDAPVVRTAIATARDSGLIPSL